MMGITEYSEIPIVMNCVTMAEQCKELDIMLSISSWTCQSHGECGISCFVTAWFIPYTTVRRTRNLNRSLPGPATQSVKSGPASWYHVTVLEHCQCILLDTSITSWNATWKYSINIHSTVMICKLQWHSNYHIGIIGAQNLESPPHDYVRTTL